MLIIFKRTMATALKARKSVLRKEIDEKLKLLTCEEKQRQSMIVYQKLINTKEFVNSSRISVYLSTKDEIDTEPILKEIFNNKKSCFVPRYDGKKMEMVKLHSMQDWNDLPLTKWNIKQPSLKEERENALETGGLDLVILPGVAFSKSGDRLGHGMGYYDKFLWHLTKNQSKKPFTVAIAFEEQIVDDLPVEGTDYKLDGIIHA